MRGSTAFPKSSGTLRLVYLAGLDGATKETNDLQHCFNRVGWNLPVLIVDRQRGQNLANPIRLYRREIRSVLGQRWQ